ncbi:MAG: tyrosine-type recombinase/integrase [Rickettsiales bacterium]
MTAHSHDDASPCGEASRLLNGFEENLRAESRLQSSVVEKYLNDCREFIAITPEFISINREGLEKYLTHLGGNRHLTARTVARKRSALRQFYRYLFTDGAIARDPARSLESVAYRRPLPRPLSEEETTKLIECAAKDPSLAGLRLRAIVELIYATGMRITECVSLPYSALQFVDGKARRRLAPFVTVKGKRGKERKLPLVDAAKEALEDYLGARDAPSGYVGFVFPSDGEEGHLTRQHVARLLKNLASKAGVPRDSVRPHLLRHSFATHLLARGASVKTVKELLGHSDISSTQIYTHVLAQRRTALVEKSSLHDEAPFISEIYVK